MNVYVNSISVYVYACVCICICNHNNTFNIHVYLLSLLLVSVQFSLPFFLSFFLPSSLEFCFCSFVLLRLIFMYVSGLSAHFLFNYYSFTTLLKDFLNFYCRTKKIGYKMYNIKCTMPVKTRKKTVFRFQMYSFFCLFIKVI